MDGALFLLRDLVSQADLAALGYEDTEGVRRRWSLLQYLLEDTVARKV